MKVGSVGSGTSTSRSQPSFSNLMCWMSDGVGVGVEVRERLKFGNPATKNLVGDRELARFVINLDG